MRREKLENLVTTGMLEGKRSRGKQREKLIEGLTRLAEGREIVGSNRSDKGQEKVEDHDRQRCKARHLTMMMSMIPTPLSCVVPPE
ncbi:hypothetical protein PoB_001520000 [Plakobranchus ocellatus]|uniref:Uncharacterized protein n=1 Tax=Plakobranchus ocellatus TaxID=259542 RepID=A0AAV3Z0I7_9GAST|nr:hypothetical protein PoB_001520000 [Plakobranchus ocellatus]